MQIKENFSIAEITNYKIGGKAKVVLECENRNDIFKALEYVQKNNEQKIFVIGGGTNLLFSDHDYDGVIIRIMTPSTPSFTLTPEGYVTAYAGESVDSLIRFSFENKMIGLEWAGGLPGTVGGAVRGNAGAFGGEIKDSFYQAEVLQMDTNTIDISRYTHQDMEFSYRDSVIKKDRNHIILTATFILSDTDQEHLSQAEDKYKTSIHYRKENHPLEYPNCGSVFKNIVNSSDVQKIIAKYPELHEMVDGKWRGKIAMGYMTKKLGFEGYTVGKAMVSKKHGNYIVNLGGATFEDVKKIIDDIQSKFQENFSFIPETEVEIVT